MPVHAKQKRMTRNGLSQLTLVEHSLCPLDSHESLRDNFSHTCEYRFVDSEQRAGKARVKVAAYEGLSAHDEFYLWGLLGIAFAQPDGGADLHVTPHYCLRQFGLIDNSSKGGESYRLFRDALRRLSALRYQNDRFYDPIRKEHRQVSFGFFSYSLPIDPESSRAWRIVWDPLFFEFCQAARSRLDFDLAMYRELTPASRRLFLLLKKVFWRRATSPRFDLVHLAVDVLGFAPSINPSDLKKKVRRTAMELVEAGIIQAPSEGASWFTKRGKGLYAVQFARGPNVGRQSVERVSKLEDSPLYDPLRSIGLDDASIARILSRYPLPLVRLWSDVTLAAMEHRKTRFFKRSPQAFFWDNLRKAKSHGRTAPDWFYQVRKEEESREMTRQSRFGPRTDGNSRSDQERGNALKRAIDPTDVEGLVRRMMGEVDREDIEE